MLPPKNGRQNMLFSATYPSNIRELAGIALRPEYQVVDTVGEEDTHAAETVRIPVRIKFCCHYVAILSALH